MIRPALALSALLLGAACAEVVVPDPSPTDRATVGARVPPPFGWADYCSRHPEDPGCR